MTDEVTLEWIPREKPPKTKKAANSVRLSGKLLTEITEKLCRRESCLAAVAKRNFASVLVATPSVDRKTPRETWTVEGAGFGRFGREKLGVGSVAILFRGQKTG